MNEAILLLYLLNFSFVDILPIIFFKKGGRLNLMWWLTASPFILCVLFLIASYLGVIPPATGYRTPTSKALGLLSIPLSVGSLVLIAFTLGTHRRRIALWHQTNDAPEAIVTYGAYGWIRHPFYAAFLVALFGALVFCPHLGTLFTFVYGYGLLNATAAREEKRLSASQFGAANKAYMKRTGRFWPTGSQKP